VQNNSKFAQTHGQRNQLVTHPSTSNSDNDDKSRRGENKKIRGMEIINIGRKKERETKKEDESPSLEWQRVTRSTYLKLGAQTEKK